MRLEMKSFLASLILKLKWALKSLLLNMSQLMLSQVKFSSELLSASWIGTLVSIFTILKLREITCWFKWTSRRAFQVNFLSQPSNGQAKAFICKWTSTWTLKLPLDVTFPQSANGQMYPTLIPSNDGVET